MLYLNLHVVGLVITLCAYMHAKSGVKGQETVVLTVSDACGAQNPYQVLLK